MDHHAYREELIYSHATDASEENLSGHSRPLIEFSYFYEPLLVQN
jgi:hypothetical protein